MTHKELCERAARWLRNSKRCDPVLSGIASAGEIPDAIGWGSDGSIVVECKTNIMDFYADKAKYERYQRGDDGWLHKGNGRVKHLIEAGYRKVEIPNMGHRRFFLCEPDVLEAAHIKDRPDHGLLHVAGRTIRLIVDAPMREKFDYHSEIRCLRFALVHLHSNLLALGCSVSIEEATKCTGQMGIELPTLKPRP